MNIFERNPKKTLATVVLILFFLMEGGLRLYSHHFGKIVDEKVFEVSDEVIENKYVHHLGTKQPNTSFIRKPGKYDSFEASNNIINSQGLRGGEVKQKSLYRIIFLGDSFIEADEIKFEDTFSELLNNVYSDKVEFISHGVSSWAPTTEFSWIYHYGLELQPDEIYLFLCWNDFFPSDTYVRSDEAYRERVILNADGVPVKYVTKEARDQMISPILFEFKKNVLQLSGEFEIGKILYVGFNMLINQIFPPLSEQDPIFLFSKNYETWPNNLKRSVDGTIKVVEEMNAFLAKRNIKLTVTLIPNPFQWKDEIMALKEYSETWNSLIQEAGSSPKDFSLDQTGLSQYLETYFKKHGINWLNLDEAFRARKAKSTKLFYLEEDGHWNKNGHQLVFDVLKERFSRPRNMLRVYPKLIE